MRSRLPILAVAVAVAATGAGCGSGSGKSKAARVAPAGVVSATLTGAGEVPKGSPLGSGTATVTLDTKGGKACWTLAVNGISHALSAHVHRGRAGVVGPVVIPLGARFATKGCVLAPAKSIAAVARNPGAFYVNVHTRKYLNGAIRGQLRARAGH
jgi:hypothetical protein